MVDGDCRITFLGMDGVEPARVEVRAWFPRLGPLTTGLTGAQVWIEAIDERRMQRTYAVRMDLAMPGANVIVTHDHPSNIAHEDLYVAIRNAFRAARRQLEDYFKASGTLPTAAEPTAAEPTAPSAELTAPSAELTAPTAEPAAPFAEPTATFAEPAAPFVKGDHSDLESRYTD